RPHQPTVRRPGPRPLRARSRPWCARSGRGVIRFLHASPGFVPTVVRGREALIATVAGTDEEQVHYAQLLLDGGTQVESALGEREEALSGAPNPSQVTLLVTLAADWELFHDASGEAFASF